MLHLTGTKGSTDLLIFWGTSASAKSEARSAGKSQEREREQVANYRWKKREEWKLISTLEESVDKHIFTPSEVPHFLFFLKLRLLGFLQKGFHRTCCLARPQHLQRTNFWDEFRLPPSERKPLKADHRSLSFPHAAASFWQNPFCWAWPAPWYFPGNERQRQ